MSQTPPARRPEVDLADYPALLFDLDGVITRTATLHSAAWKRLFDEFLADWDREHGAETKPFDLPVDYPAYIDGRRRYDGVSAFLESREIELPYGEPDDDPSALTVCGLGNRKNGYFYDELEGNGVEVFDDTVALAKAWHERGSALAVVSASESARPILERVGVIDLFQVVVSGVEASKLNLAGKPKPDTFLEAARELGFPPEKAVVFEDAIAGVQAGRAGGFGLVVGVDRGGAEEGLAKNGADIVSSDLTELI